MAKPDADRLAAPAKRADDADATIRPQRLEDFVGQPQLKANLRVFIEAARGRGEALDHVLFHGPPGLGKTTLAQIVARELGVGFRATSGPVIARAGDLAAILTNLQPRDVLFIDEIHRLNPAIEEILYPAMEDFQLDLIIGEGPAARSVRIDLQPFTLVGATTRSGLLTTPLRERFGIPQRLEFYAPEDLAKIVTRAAEIFAIAIGADAALEIARRARGTPRIAGRLLRRVRDFAAMANDGSITLALAKSGLARLDIDEGGLDAMDRRYLRVIAEFVSGRPGRRRNPGRHSRRTARHDRGRDRTLFDSSRARAAHAARPYADLRGLDLSRPEGAEGTRGAPARSARIRRRERRQR